MTEPITAVAIRTYLACPRRYDLRHRQGLADRQSPEATRLELCRTAITEAMQQGGDPAGLVERGETALEREWADHDEQFHARAQRDHSRRVLAAGIKAHLESTGADHLSGLEALLDAGVSRQALVGPDLSLSGSVAGTPVSAPVDYITADGRAVIAVRVIDTPTRLGAIRFERDWEDLIEPTVSGHFDPADPTHDVPTVGTLLETAVVLAGLRTWCADHELEDRLCRYCCVPVLTPWQREINWRRNTVTSTVSPVDCTESYIEEQALARTLEHRNDEIEAHLERIVGQISAGNFDPTDRWSTIESAECPGCPVAVGCQDAIAEEVRYDG
ncbi:MAG: hypothetical protein U5K37_10335 [Natrialbaceae archaeon]|nr:hypothetical protein [Natrialbaceae archaeon]